MTAPVNPSPVPTDALAEAIEQFLATAPPTASDADNAAQRAVQALLDRLAELEVELATLRERASSVDDLEVRLLEAEQLVGRERELSLEVGQLEDRNRELLATLDGVFRSTSWRATAPLRRAMDVARTSAVDAVRQFRKG